MNSVRPLITITILAIVAYFLYVKINQGVLRPGPATNESTQTLAPASVPPLAGQTVTSDKNATTADARPSGSSVAPNWPNAAAPDKPSIHGGQPEAPAIPDLPALPAIPEISPAKIGAAPPTNPPLAAADSKTTLLPGGATAPASASERDSSNENAMNAMGLTPQSMTLPTTTTDVPPAAAPAAAVDRYGFPLNNSTATPTAPAANTNPAATVNGPSFSAAWPSIQSALNRGELARAHQMLSPWFGDPSLTPAESERVDALLGQLAGTVIYSTEHRLEPAYTVKTGETLEAIAKQYDVPWQLLAKINGVATPDQIRPGQQLKVVRGPFGAMVDLRRNQLALSVDGRYAGKFTVNAPAATSIPAGEWVVADKPATPAAAASVYASPGSLTAPAAVSRSIVLRSAPGDTAKAGMAVRIAATESAITPVSAADPRADASSNSPYFVKVSPRDAEELSDILSIGSRVIIQR